MHIKKINLFILLFVSHISAFNYQSTTVIIKNDINYNARNWLYKMEPYIATNEDIKKNKVMYEVIIEENLWNLQCLQDQKKNINNFFLLPTAIICSGLLAYTSYYIYILKGKTIYHNGFDKPENTDYKIMSVPIAITGVLSFLGYNSRKKEIKNLQDHIDRDLRILAALRNL